MQNLHKAARCNKTDEKRASLPNQRKILILVCKHFDQTLSFYALAHGRGQFSVESDLTCSYQWAFVREGKLFSLSFRVIHHSTLLAPYERAPQTMK